jgi:hypothetical protein
MRAAHPTLKMAKINITSLIFSPDPHPNSPKNNPPPALPLSKRLKLTYAAPAAPRQANNEEEMQGGFARGGAAVAKGKDKKMQNEKRGGSVR